MEAKMLKRGIFIFLLAFLTVALYAGNTGKIRGTVVDAETGDPLPGANVMILDTQMGAATDVNGNFIILNVPSGKYTVKATFVGYRNVAIQNNIVISDRTTEINFQLPPITLEGETVTIIAEKPLVDKNVTNYTKTMWAEDLENLPIRGVTEVVSSMAGAVNRGGLHIRGGRDHEVARYIDGIATTSIVDGGNNISIIDRAIEMIDYQAGGFTAEYGFANSGVIHTELKTGGPEYHFSFEAVSDEFWSTYSDDKGHTILGIEDQYSFGYNHYYVTASGPILPSLKNVRFFAAYEHYYEASDANRFQGWEQDSLQLIKDWSLNPSGTHTDTMQLYADIPPGRLPGGGRLGDNLNVNVVWDKQPFRVKIGGTLHLSERNSASNGDPAGLYSVESRSRKYKYNNMSGYLQFTHSVDPTMFYTVNLNYARYNSKNGDPWYWDDIAKIGDPVFNSAVADTGVAKTFRHPIGVSLNAPYYPVNTFNKYQESYMGLKFDLTKQVGKRHEFKIGGEVNYHTLRRYTIATISMLQSFANQSASMDGASPITDYVAYRSFLRNYGYDIYGNEINSDKEYSVWVGDEFLYFNGLDGPPHPIMAGFYLQDKIELRDLTLNAGVRLDYFDRNIKKFKDVTNIQDAPTGFFDEETFEEADPDIFASPRLGFSFPVTDQTVFHAQYGKFVQLSRFDNMFESWGYMANSLFSGGYAREYPNPNLKPERTTSYEFGFKQQFGPNAALNATVFYKNTDNLVAIRKIIPQAGTSYTSPYLDSNADFGTIKGLTLDFTLRRWNKIAATANYTLSWAEGTGSSSDSHFDIAWAEGDPVFPTVIQPLDFDVRHKGTLIADIRLNDDDGPELFGMKPLASVGLNMLFSFHSGYPFTRIQSGSSYSEVFGYTQGKPIEGINSSRMPWFYQLDAKLDKTFNAGPFDMNVYLWVINLFDTKSIIDVFSQTGTPESDGHLESEDGKKRARDYEGGQEEYVKWYQAMLTNSGTFGWQEPRQIRLGVKIEM
jgi:outer membrane receptor protein involved in Fe transport